MAGERSVSFDVRGAPVPQGSVVAYAAKRKDGSHYGVVHYAVGTKLHAWRRAVSVAARAEWGDELTFHHVTLDLLFHIKRPNSHFVGLHGDIQPRYINARPDNPPDLDKLVRAVMDALTDIVYGDDSQVTSICAEKIYGTPGVRVSIRAVP